MHGIPKAKQVSKQASKQASCMFLATEARGQRNQPWLWLRDLWGSSGCRWELSDQHTFRERDRGPQGRYEALKGLIRPLMALYEALKAL